MDQTGEVGLEEVASTETRTSFLTSEEFESLRENPEELRARADQRISALIQELQSAKSEKALAEVNFGKDTKHP